jgi:hypothetical protein
MLKRMPSVLLFSSIAAFTYVGEAKAAPDILIRSTIQLDVTKKVVTLPLFRGTFKGQNVWYIVTESSDEADAEARGVNFAPKLLNALGTAAVQQARAINGVVSFPGTVDFSRAPMVVPSATGFPPTAATPGPVADANYSPLVTLGNGIVLNAPQIANASGRHPIVTSLDTAAGRVSLLVLEGRTEGAKILYLRTEGSDAGLAAIESTTFTPNMNAAPGIASDSLATSARSGIVPVVNGARGVTNPDRQGLQSALLGEGDPINITQHYPDGSDQYSPFWDVHPAVWTDAAIAAGQRRLLSSFEDVANEVNAGRIVSGGAGPQNRALGGLRAAGFISNCPIVAIF